MKKGLIALSLLPLGALTLGLGIALSVSHAPAVETKAEGAGTAWYVRGTMNEWTGSDAYKIIEDGDPLILDLAVGDKFKVANDVSKWDDSGATVLTTSDGDASGNGINFSEGYDSYVATAGKYAFSVKDGALYVDFGNLYYSGTGTDPEWGMTNDAKHPALVVNGGSQTWQLAEGDMFKIRNNNWDKGVFGYSNLKDGDFYGSFSCGTGSNDNNVVTEIAGSYDVSASMTGRVWTIRVVPSGVNPDSRAFVYVLDKYGNKLSSSHYAYLNNASGQETGWPGALMSKYEGTTHMYQQDFWVGMEKVQFNNNSKKTWSWDISGTYSNAGKCLILGDDVDGEGNWSSDTWVLPETGKFIENCLHFANYKEDQQGSGDCISQGWYTTAKSAYSALSPEAKAEVSGLSDVSARLSAWAAANRETFTITAGVGAFGAGNVLPTVSASANWQMVLIASVGAFSAAGLVTLAIYRKKKSNAK